MFGEKVANRPRVIAGYGRSGTTWIQDALAVANRMRAVFEPLHPLVIRGAEPFANRRLTSADEEPDLHSLLSRYFYGSYHSLWADYRVLYMRTFPRRQDWTSAERIRQIANYDRNALKNIGRFFRQRFHQERIVKLIRANMMLGWIKRSFEARIAFVIRHPVPVVLSQLSARYWNPYSQIERYRSDSRLLETLRASSRKLIFQDLEPVEAYALAWCVENEIALADAGEHGIPIIYYENLIRLGEPEWRRIADALDLPMIPDDKLIAEPSQQTRREKAKNADLVRRYGLWTKRVDSDTARGIQRILDLTESTVYGVQQPLPIHVP